MYNEELMKNNQLIGQIQALLVQLSAQLASTQVVTPAPNEPQQPEELLTITECCEEVKGLTYFTVRQAVLRGELPAVRTGRGQNGKILISRSALQKYVGTK